MSRRIAIVTDWFAPRRGGIESQLGELAARLAASGDRVTVLTTTPGEPSSAPVEVRRIAVLRWPSPPLAISPRLLSVLRRELSTGFDVVHAHVSIVSPVGWLGAMAARSLGLPTVLTFHSVLRGKALLLRAIGNVVPIRSSQVVWTAVSRHVAAQVQWGLGAETTVAVLPNGIELEAWQPRASVADRGETVFVSAMRLHRKKRGVHLVRAFAQAVRNFPGPARLVIVGDGPSRASIAREVGRCGLSAGKHQVELHAWLSPEALRRLYARADAFAMASIHESFGIAALEARAAGLPVIARRSGNADFLRHDDNALLAEDDAELARFLREFLESAPLRRRLSDAASALAGYDWNAVLAAHRRQYDRATALAAADAAVVVA